MAVKGATRATYTPPSTYTFKQIEQLWVDEGGALAEAPLAASVALAESGGNPRAENHNTNGSVDRGLFQINSVHGSLSTTNVAANVAAAVKINKESGWSPWVTYKTGAYKKYYQAASIPLEKGEATQGIVEHPLKDLQNLVTGKTAEEVGKEAGNAAKKAATGWVGEITGFLGKEVVAGVLLLAGAVLVVYGIMVAVRPRERAFSVPLPV